MQMKRDFVIIALFLLSLYLISCTQPPDFPDEPVIEFMSISKNQMIQGSFTEDSIIVAFSFTDGDGDLGDDDSINVFLTDSRDDFIANQYRIPFIPEEGAANGISGEIFLTVFTTCCTFPDATLPCTPSTAHPRDSLRYLIQIRDRAGNWSNEISTDLIYILCQ